MDGEREVQAAVDEGRLRKGKGFTWTVRNPTDWAILIYEVPFLQSKFTLRKVD